MKENLVFDLVMAVRAEMIAAVALERSFQTNWHLDGPATESERIPLRAALEAAMRARYEAEKNVINALR